MERTHAFKTARSSKNEFGLWALEIPGVADFAGFVGLAMPTFEAHFTPCIEVGWRLGMQHDSDQDFDHPGLPQGHRLQRHVLYRLTQLEWSNSAFFDHA